MDNAFYRCRPIQKLLGREFRELRQLTYPPAYVACFEKECTNSTSWAHYADGHRGVCLIFRSVQENGRSCMYLNNVMAEFQPVKYGADIPEIDFFRSFGRLPIADITKNRYTDSDGNQSKCNRIFSSENSLTEERKHGTTNRNSSA